jgi:hypothetical protein
MHKDHAIDMIGSKIRVTNSNSMHFDRTGTVISLRGQLNRLTVETEGGLTFGVLRSSVSLIDDEFKSESLPAPAVKAFVFAPSNSEKISSVMHARSHFDPEDFRVSFDSDLESFMKSQSDVLEGLFSECSYVYVIEGGDIYKLSRTTVVTKL